MAGLQKTSHLLFLNFFFNSSHWSQCPQNMMTGETTLFFLPMNYVHFPVYHYPAVHFLISLFIETKAESQLLERISRR